MATQWPEQWVTLHCPKGHEITSYEMAEMPVDDGVGRVYCICKCGTPCAFQGDFRRDSVDLPRRYELPANPDDNDFYKGV